MAEEIRRIIHVKGIGNAAQTPDQVTISLELEATDKDYSNAVEKIAEKISALRASVVAAGFNTDELKTVRFYVEPVYDWQKINGVEKQIFQFYGAKHNLELTFDFVNEQLNKALCTLTDCTANPKFSVRFQLKDKTELEAKVFKSAAEDALCKAEILCAASGAKLGKLLNIGCTPSDYLRGISETRLDNLNPMLPAFRRDMKIFIPKDIEAEEKIDFYWEILD